MDRQGLFVQCEGAATECFPDAPVVLDVGEHVRIVTALGRRLHVTETDQPVWSPWNCSGGEKKDDADWQSEKKIMHME